MLPRPVFAFSPPQFFIFRFAKCAAKKNGVVFAPPACSRTTLNSIVKMKEKMYSNNEFEIQVFTKIGKNIKKLRQAKELSQDRLSKLADVSYNSIIKL